MRDIGKKRRRYCRSVNENFSTTRYISSPRTRAVSDLFPLPASHHKHLPLLPGRRKRKRECEAIRRVERLENLVPGECKSRTNNGNCIGFMARPPMQQLLRSPDLYFLPHMIREVLSLRKVIRLYTYLRIYIHANAKALRCGSFTIKSLIVN